MLSILTVLGCAYVLIGIEVAAWDLGNNKSVRFFFDPKWDWIEFLIMVVIGPLLGLIAIVISPWHK